MTYHEGPYIVKKAGQVVENLIIVTQPGEDTALKIAKNDVTIRNVVIYHPASARGIFGWYPANLRLENVEVIAYGNAWGANPCPSRNPFNGYECTNIKIYNAENLVISNVRVENGSKGISIQRSPGALLTHVVARNVRGPFPAGQCFQIARSDDVTVENFHCFNDIYLSWSGDSISAWRSSNVSFINGVVDGNTSPTGICLMFEGSKKGTHGGLIQSVEAIHCQGCFSGFPANGLREVNVTCA